MQYVTLVTIKETPARQSESLSNPTGKGEIPSHSIFYSYYNCLIRKKQDIRYWAIFDCNPTLVTKTRPPLYQAKVSLPPGKGEIPSHPYLTLIIASFSNKTRNEVGNMLWTAFVLSILALIMSTIALLLMKKL